MIGGVAKKYTHGGTWRQLVGRSGGQVGIALRAKDTQMRICGWHVVKHEVRSGEGEGFVGRRLRRYVTA